MMMAQQRWFTTLLATAAIALLASGCTYFRREDADHTESTSPPPAFR
jgi:hypothetical protein